MPFCSVLKTPAKNQVVLESKFAPPAAIASVTRIKTNLASTARQFLGQSLTSRNAGLFAELRLFYAARADGELEQLSAGSIKPSRDADACRNRPGKSSAWNSLLVRRRRTQVSRKSSDSGSVALEHVGQYERSSVKKDFCTTIGTFLTCRDDRNRWGQS